MSQEVSLYLHLNNPFPLEIKDTPGPGTYKVPSAFDKFKRLPAKQYMTLKENGGVSPNQGYATQNQQSSYRGLDLADDL